MTWQLYLPTALARKVLQSAPSVCQSVCFHSVGATSSDGSSSGTFNCSRPIRCSSLCILMSILQKSN